MKISSEPFKSKGIKNSGVKLELTRMSGSVLGLMLSKFFLLKHRFSGIRHFCTRQKPGFSSFSAGGKSFFLPQNGIKRRFKRLMVRGMFGRAGVGSENSTGR
jgi:hypothetical protein